MKADKKLDEMLAELQVYRVRSGKGSGRVEADDIVSADKVFRARYPYVYKVTDITLMEKRN